MAHYRKVDTYIWNDKKFNGLSRDARFLFLCLLTHPNLTVLGAMRASARGLGEELQFSSDELDHALNELVVKQLVRYAYGECFIWLPNFLKYNPPDSPNVVKSWEGALHYLPECTLKNTLVSEAAKLTASWGKSFQDALPQSMRQGVYREEPALKEESDLKSDHPTQPLSANEVNPSVRPTSREGVSLTHPPTLGVTHPLTPGVTHPLTPGVTHPLTPGVTHPLTPGVTHPLTPGVTHTPTHTLITEHRALNTEHGTLSTKAEEILLETDPEEKNNIGEINTIVAPARHKTAKPPDSEVIKVFRCWQQTLDHPQAQLDAKRRKIIRRALASGYSVAQLCEAIQGCSQTPHNRGENDQGQRFDGLHIIFRDADQIDRFIRNGHSPPRRRTAADQLLADNLAAGERWLALYQPEEKTIDAINGSSCL